jgi:two-component system invasion response regulator UvrY
MLRILIADDHQIVRRGIRQILVEGLPFPEIAEASDTSSLIEKALANDWDIIISDLSMPGGGGLEAIREIKKVKPKQPILIVSIFPGEQYAVKVLSIGAAGYLNKDAATDELLKAVNTLITGRRYIQPAIAEKLTVVSQRQAGLLPHELLSERELEVMMKLVEGMSITEIASELAVSPNTVSTYRARILQKMNMRTNADMIFYTVKNTLV